MNKYKQVLKEYNKSINGEIKNKKALNFSEKTELKSNSMYQIICYYRLNKLVKNKRITKKRGKTLAKLLDFYFEYDRSTLDNVLMNEKLSNRLMKIETILSSYHLLDEINITKYIKQDILKKTKK